MTMYQLSICYPAHAQEPPSEELELIMVEMNKVGAAMVERGGCGSLAEACMIRRPPRLLWTRKVSCCSLMVPSSNPRSRSGASPSLRQPISTRRSLGLSSNLQLPVFRSKCVRSSMATAVRELLLSVRQKVGAECRSILCDFAMRVRARKGRGSPIERRGSCLSTC